MVSSIPRYAKHGLTSSTSSSYQDSAATSTCISRDYSNDGSLPTFSDADDACKHSRSKQKKTKLADCHSMSGNISGNISSDNAWSPWWYRQWWAAVIKPTSLSAAHSASRSASRSALSAAAAGTGAKGCTRGVTSASFLCACGLMLGIWTLVCMLIHSGQVRKQH